MTEVKKLSATERISPWIADILTVTISCNYFTEKIFTKIIMVAFAIPEYDVCMKHLESCQMFRL